MGNGPLRAGCVYSASSQADADAALKTWGGASRPVHGGGIALRLATLPTQRLLLLQLIARHVELVVMPMDRMFVCGTDCCKGDGGSCVEVPKSTCCSWFTLPWSIPKGKLAVVAWGVVRGRGD